MPHLLRYALSLLAVVATLAVACVQPAAPDGLPTLPEGFGAILPDVPLGGYIYLSQPDEDNPIVLDADLVAPEGTHVPLAGDLHSISLWFGPAAGDGYLTVTTRLTFIDENDAVGAEARLGDAVKSGDLWVQRKGLVLDVVFGSNSYAETVRDALRTEQYTDLRTAQNAVWNTTLSLPRTSSRPPIAAGYLQFSPQLLPVIFDLMAFQSGLDIRSFGTLLTRVGAINAAFAVYGDSFPPLNTEAASWDLASHGITAVIVTETSLPAPLLSWSFNLGAQRLGLSSVQTDGGRAFLLRTDGLVTLSRTNDSAVYVALAFSESEARDLLGRVGR